MVTLEGIFLWNYHPYREAEGLVRERVGHWTILRAVATPVPDTKSNPIQRAGPSVWPERFARGLDKNVDLWSPNSVRHAKCSWSSFIWKGIKLEAVYPASFLLGAAMRSALVNWEWYRVSQKKHSYKIFGLEIMLFTCSQTLWSGLRSSFTKWGTAPAFTTACKTTMSASRWRAWSLVQKFYKSVFSGTPCR